MHFNKFWKASALLAVFATPIAVYTIKPKDGEIWGWGSGRNGQLGTGKQINCSQPTKINYAFVEIKAGKAISAGITADGKLWTWGKNRNGILGHSPPNINVFLPRVVNSVEKVVQISCGQSHICAVTEQGQAYIWGTNQVHGSFRKIGKTETVRQTMTDVIPQKINLSNIKQVSCAGDSTILVNKQGKVFIIPISTSPAIGNKKSQQKSIINELKIKQPVCRVESGSDFSMALTQDGKIYVWGKNNCGQLGIGSFNQIRIPIILDALSNEKIIDISCGDNFSGAITENGDVYTWGFGNQGQLGHGDKSDQMLPRKIQIKEKAKKISCGGAHTGFLTDMGKLFMMGRGREGQLGRLFNDQGNSGYSLKPRTVEQLPANKKISKFSCGGTHTLVLLEQL